MQPYEQKAHSEPMLTMRDSYHPEFIFTVIASVAAVVWTGAFIIRTWRGQSGPLMEFAADSAAAAFMIPIFALLMPSRVFHAFTIGALVVFALVDLGFIVAVGSTRRSRKKVEGSFGKWVDMPGYAFLIRGLVHLGPLVAIALWTSDAVAAWVATVMLFLGYQFMTLYMIFPDSRFEVNVRSVPSTNDRDIG